jgi:hypothetical protein
MHIASHMQEHIKSIDNYNLSLVSPVYHICCHMLHYSLLRVHRCLQDSISFILTNPDYIIIIPREM